MPQGNAGYQPSGLWYFDPLPANKATVPRLIFKTCRSIFYCYLAYEAIHQWRSMNWKYTYTNFIGKTVIYENFAHMTHEPLPAEEIDKLKEKERARKGKKI